MATTGTVVSSRFALTDSPTPWVVVLAVVAALAAVAASAEGSAVVAALAVAAVSEAVAALVVAATVAVVLEDLLLVEPDSAALKTRRWLPMHSPILRLLMAKEARLSSFAT